MRYFARGERVRNDADDLAARSERCIRKRAHQADAPAAVDKAQAALGKPAAEVCRRLAIQRTVAFARAAEDANAFEDDPVQLEIARAYRPSADSG